MYLTTPQLKEILAAYTQENLTEDNHYQVGPDTWVYLFQDSNNKKYVLISADYLDFDFDHFPHLLRFDDSEFHKIDFVLQKEIIPLDTKKAENTILFEYTN